MDINLQLPTAPNEALSSNKPRSCKRGTKTLNTAGKKKSNSSKKTKVIPVSSGDESESAHKHTEDNTSSNADSDNEVSPDQARSNFSMNEDILPAEARLFKGQKAKLNKMSMGKVLDLVKLKREAEQASLGENSSKYSKYRAPKLKTFKEQSDDGFKELHKARFLRAPLSSTGKWWKCGSSFLQTTTYKSLCSLLSLRKSMDLEQFMTYGTSLVSQRYFRILLYLYK